MQSVRTSVVLCLGVLFAFPGYADIYQDLWDLDQMENGLSAETVKPGAPATKDIQVDPQAPAKKGLNDAAKNPYFASVKTDKLSAETYKTLEPLFDNYNLEDSEGEDALGANPTEDKEIDAFLTAVTKTVVADEALAFINKKQLAGRKLSVEDFKAELKRIWFQPYDNFFRTAGKSAKRSPDCTGFEHVFVGEASGPSGIGGYHNWYKFYLEEKAGRTNYLGWAEGPIGAETVAHVATFAMSWDTKSGELEKPITGFLVGNSPELQLMWGTIAYYQTARASQFADVNIVVTIGDAIMSLVLYREVLEKGVDDKPVRGDQIRSFYPKLISLQSYKD